MYGDMHVSSARAVATRSMRNASAVLAMMSPSRWEDRAAQAGGQRGTSRGPESDKARFGRLPRAVVPTDPVRYWLLASTGTGAPPYRTSLLTERTPGVSRAMRSTESRSADFATEPVTRTTPAAVATVIANGFVWASAARRARTSSVIAVSSRWTTGAWPTHPVAPMSIAIASVASAFTGRGPLRLNAVMVG